MSTAELDIKIDSRDVPNATRELKRLEQQGAATDGKMRSLGDASSDAGGKLDGAAKAAKGMGVALAAMGVAKVAVDMAKLADETNLLQSRVKRLAGDLSDYAFAWQALLDTANQSGAAMGDTVKLWESLDQSVAATDSQIITLTGTLQKLGKIGGSSIEEMSNSLRQLGQSFAGGIVRAEEFNSVLEGTPEIWRRVAAAQDISLGELRTKMLEGKLTADEVFNSLMSQVDSVNADFEKMPRTIEQASQALSNNFAGAVAALDNQIGTSKFLSKMLDALARGAAEFTLQIEAAPGAEASVALNEIDAQLAKIAESRAAYDAVVASGDSAAIAAMAMGGSSQEAMNRLRAQEIALLERRDQILGEMADREGGKAPPSAGSGMSSAASGPKTTTAADDEEDKKAKRAADAAKRAYDAKIAALAKEQQAEADDYNRRLQAAGEFNARMEALNASELDKAKNERGQRMIENQAAYNNDLISEEQYQLNLSAIKQRYEADRTAIQKQELEKQRQLASDSANILIQQTQFMTGTIADMLMDSGKENSGLMQGMLAAQKALAIPSIIVSTEQAAMAAMAHESLLGGLLSGTMAANLIRAQGAISAGIVAGQAIGGFAGMFDNGGNIGSGQWGIVGENGPEIVKGPANVTSRKKTAALAASAVGGADGGTVVNNYITQNIQGNGDQALAEVVDRATKNALNEVQRDFATNGRIRKTAGV